MYKDLHVMWDHNGSTRSFSAAAATTTTTNTTTTTTTTTTNNNNNNNTCVYISYSTGLR